MGGEPDLKAALQAMLDRERDEMEAPTPKELIAYRDGLLSERERAAVERKLAVFPESGEALRDLARFPDIDPPPDAEPLTEERLDESWRQFRDRLEAGERATEPPAPRASRDTAIPPWKRIFGGVPAPVWASTAVLAAGVLGWAFGVLSAPSLLPRTQTPEAGVPLLELSPEPLTERDTAPPRTRVESGSPLFVALELPPGPRAATYEIEIEAPGQGTWTGTAEPTDFGGLHVSLPATYLTPGEVRIAVRGAPGTEPVVYRFEVR